MRRCTNCANCDYRRGFMVTCHYSYDEDGWHHQVGQDVPFQTAEKCKYYTEDGTGRDEFFVL